MVNNSLERPVTGSLVSSRLPVIPRPRAAWARLLPMCISSAAQARSDTEGFLNTCAGAPVDLTFTAVLLVSELVTNAYTAMAGITRATHIEFSLRLFDDHLLAEVIDISPKPPVLKKPWDDAENGRGLALVDALSQEWGYFRHRDKKVVYFILPYTPENKTEERATTRLLCLSEAVSAAGNASEHAREHVPLDGRVTEGK